MEQLDNLSAFFNGKTVLITGHTGFKGSWLAIWLYRMGANVIGYALDPQNEKDNYVLSGIQNYITDIRGDVRDRKLLDEIFLKYRPEIVFHLAAQPLVRLSYENPVETYDVNVMGTIYVMEAIRSCPSVKVGVMITTDKCYENKEQIWGYRENEAMGGYDPYSSSKGACELAIASWRRSFMNPDHLDAHGKAIASVRAGNVIGGGDWSKDRIIPDCIRSLESGYPIGIRNPQAIRPWQHVLEPLSGYLLLAKKMWENSSRYSEAWNFGPRPESVASVWEIARKIIKYYGEGELQDVSDNQSLHEAQLLMLDISKAKFRLGWEPRIDLEQAIQLTVDWYKKYKNRNIFELCIEQIDQYLKVK
jgi:CDP-glucose 4,6-dehydratase